MNQIETLSRTHGFVFLAGRLVECDAKQLKYVLDENNILQPVELTIAFGDETAVVEPSEFFESVQDFRSGRCAELGKHVYLNLCVKNAAWSENAFPYTHIINNGRVEKKVIDIQTLYIEFGPKMKVSSPDIPMTCWLAYEDALAHVDLKVHKADGTEETIQSAASLLALNAEQRKVVKKIAELTKQATELGVVFIGDFSDHVYAFSNHGIESWFSDYSRNTEDGWESLDVQNDEFDTDIRINVVSDENIVNIKRKSDK